MSVVAECAEAWRLRLGRPYAAGARSGGSDLVAQHVAIVRRLLQA